MKIEEFVSLNRVWGISLKKVGKNYFQRRRDKGSPFPVYYSFPLNQKVIIDRKLVRALRRNFLLTQVVLNLPKKDKYEYVLTEGSYNLDQFDGKVRNKIRKSLKSCSFRKPGLDDLLNDGLAINRQICKLQSWTDESLTDEHQWTGYINSIHSHEGFNILGAFLEERMIGYLVAYELEGQFNLLEAFIDRDYSSGTSPMNGLLFNLVNDLISKHGTITLSYGEHKFSKLTPLTRFKQKMLFQKYAATKGYVVHPLLLLVIRLMVFFMIKILKRKSLKREWEKAIIRIFQGHRKVMSTI
ncbi:MAG: hypothetical protein GY790_00785 [Bacteroidetes bacterium]|nr:hypothetical protein [Bacteroidota bacterium]